MQVFIQVTELLGETNTRPKLLNVSHIISISRLKYWDGVETTHIITSKSDMEVKESYEEMIKLLVGVEKWKS